jgi:hypothetical protein
MRECRHCCEKFHATRKDKIFCSKSCKNKFSSIKYRKENVEKIKEYNKAYREENKLKLAKQAKEWRENNKEYLKQKKKEWQITFKKKYGIAHTTFQRQNNINERIKHNIRVRINKALKDINKSGSAVEELGCSFDYFKEHISSQFQEGMTWDNYGEWHIDHIKPLDSFDLSDLDEFKEACNYKNLRPLWAKDNLSKGSKNPFEV